MRQEVVRNTKCKMEMIPEEGGVERHPTLQCRPLEQRISGLLPSFEAPGHTNMKKYQKQVYQSCVYMCA